VYVPVDGKFTRSNTHQCRPIPAAAGIGLRLPHHQCFIESRPQVSWLEVHPENYMTGSAACAELELIANHYPLSFHAVGLSLGSATGPDPTHLERLCDLVTRYQPRLVSDHLSWSAIDGIHLPDLLPLPYTEEALEVLAASVEQVQSVINRPILIENPSHYFTLPESTLTEAEFLGLLVRRTGCGVLLDVNNIYVSALNCGQDPGAQLTEYLERIPHKSIGELHLAGHCVVVGRDGRERRLDDHGSRVDPAVWHLFGTTVQRLGPRPTLVEWDTRLPSFEVLLDEARDAQWIIEASMTEEDSFVSFG
jgi:hypothetical protein